jgi:hypothetical protein
MLIALHLGAGGQTSLGLGSELVKSNQKSSRSTMAGKRRRDETRRDEELQTDNNRTIVFQFNT